MNTKDLVEYLSESMDLSRVVCKKIVTIIIDKIVNEVKLGDEVKVQDLGIFYKSERKSRVARNPKTGEKVIVKKKLVPRFRPSKSFKEKIKKSS